MKAVKSTIPVYDICSLENNGQNNKGVVAAAFGDYLRDHPNLHWPHRHSFYHVVLFTGGKGFHTIDFQRFDVKAGQVYFMVPGQVHTWDFQGEPEGYVLNFSETLFDQFLFEHHYLDHFPVLQGLAAEGVVQLGRKDIQRAVTLLNELIAELDNPAYMGPDMMRTYILQLLILVSRNRVPAKDVLARPHNQVLLAQFRKLIEQHFAEKRLPKEYAEMLYVTPNHLNALCRDTVDKAAGEIIRDRILLEAKRLLVNADLPVATVAGELNFTDNSHFTRFFKKHTGHTPEEFRRTYINNH